MFKRVIAWYLVMAMFIIGIAPKVEAGFAPSGVVALAPSDRDADLKKIQSVLENRIVKQRLHDLGFTDDEIRVRLSQLSDQQIHKLAMEIDNLKVGDDALGVIIALLIIAILIVVLLQLMGHKVIITK